MIDITGGLIKNPTSEAPYIIVVFPNWSRQKITITDRNILNRIKQGDTVTIIYSKVYLKPLGEKDRLAQMDDELLDEYKYDETGERMLGYNIHAVVPDVK